MLLVFVPGMVVIVSVITTHLTLRGRDSRFI